MAIKAMQDPSVYTEIHTHILTYYSSCTTINCRDVEQSPAGIVSLTEPETRASLRGLSRMVLVNSCDSVFFLSKTLEICLIPPPREVQLAAAGLWFWGLRAFKLYGFKAGQAVGSCGRHPLGTLQDTPKCHRIETQTG